MEKKVILKSMGCLNKYADEVKSDLFSKSNFFDPEDKIQVKYEMLRAVNVDGMSITEAAEAFGYSRETYYTVADNFRLEGTVGLMDKEQGRRQPEKLVDEVVKYITQERKKDPENNPGKVIAEKVWEKFKIKLHEKTIYKALKKTALR